MKWSDTESAACQSARLKVLGGIEMGLLLCVVEIKLCLASIGAEEEPWDAGDGVRAADHGQLRLRPGHLAPSGGPEEHVGFAHSVIRWTSLNSLQDQAESSARGPAQAVPTNQQLFRRVQEFSDIRPN